MNRVYQLLATAAAERPVDLLPEPAAAPESFGSVGALSAPSASKAPASAGVDPSAPAVEIDVGEVVAHLRRALAPDVDELADFSLECAVKELAPPERHLVALDACPVCGGEWARARYGLP